MNQSGIRNYTISATIKTLSILIFELMGTIWISSLSQHELRNLQEDVHENHASTWDPAISQSWNSDKKMLECGKRSTFQLPSQDNDWELRVWHRQTKPALHDFQSYCFALPGLGTWPWAWRQEIGQFLPLQLIGANPQNMRNASMKMVSNTAGFLQGLIKNVIRACLREVSLSHELNNEDESSDGPMQSYVSVIDRLLTMISQQPSARTKVTYEGFGTRQEHVVSSTTWGLSDETKAQRFS